MENKKVHVRVILRGEGEVVKIYNHPFITKNIFSLSEDENWIQWQSNLK